MRTTVMTLVAVLLLLSSCVSEPEPYKLTPREPQKNVSDEIAQIEANAKAQVDAQYAAHQAAEEKKKETLNVEESTPKLVLQQTSSPSSAALGLYPSYFMDGAAFKQDFVTVVGGEAPASYVVAIANLIARTPGKKPVGFSMLDGDITDITHDDAIVVGNACNNEVIAKLFSNPAPCDNAPLPDGKGLIRLYQSADGHVLLLAAGKTDAQVISAVNMIGTDAFKALTGSETCVDGVRLVTC